MKPSFTVPHGGGMVIGFESSTQLNKYDAVLRWIMDGAKNN